MATINVDVHQKFRNVKKLSTRQAGDGNEGEVEVREDEEQSIKLQEILDLLVAAGYFRARIKGLSPFDKIVGGMTWCIESCNVDVDVDLLFQENSTIGQKIALTEKIVAVLPKLNCPHRIEPHQIQGLDCVHIFPVIQWLVKRSMEFREEMSLFVRSYAVSQFNKEFPSQNKNADIQKQVLNNVNTIREIYKPHRYYRRKNAPPEDLPSKVQITLLEYGLRGDIHHSIKNEPDVLEHETMDELDIQKLLSSMALTKEDNFDHFMLNDDLRLELIKHYATLQSEIEDGGVKSMEEKRKFALQQQNQILMERNSKLLEEIKLLEASISENSSILENIKTNQNEADKALKELAQGENEHSKHLKEVEDLVILNDTVKAQEVQFREQCKQELAQLQNLIEEAKNAKTPIVPEVTNKEIEEESEKLKLLRLQLAKKNRSIALIQRKLDEIPSRAELAQYQKRFLELYNQVAAKHKETKQYYTLYNTLEDTRTYIKKELSLLNSICDNYPEAISSNSGKDEFLKQLELIVNGVKQSKAKIETKLNEEKFKRDELCNTLHCLVEQQRRYVTAVRQLSIECKKHESLLSQQQ
ncbi:hypothetical protein RN001_010060 [Aquatica leii]|uniref:Coiled-coil domain-containing protein 93 n=1 Tax=Aquatica leii TaxID=1421715 RepID=A0AAN7P5X0_9COLE|nr:hypothetical protein RN001_010060 [Aquatica leii]